MNSSETIRKQKDNARKRKKRPTVKSYKCISSTEDSEDNISIAQLCDNGEDDDEDDDVGNDGEVENRDIFAL